MVFFRSARGVEGSLVKTCDNRRLIRSNFVSSAARVRSSLFSFSAEPARCNRKFFREQLLQSDMEHYGLQREKNLSQRISLSSLSLTVSQSHVTGPRLHTLVSSSEDRSFSPKFGRFFSDRLEHFFVSILQVAAIVVVDFTSTSKKVLQRECAV